jgi:hypothetical protein
MYIRSNRSIQIKPQIEFLGFQIAYITYIEMINPRIKSLLLKISFNHVTCQEKTQSDLQFALITTKCAIENKTIENENTKIQNILNSDTIVRYHNITNVLEFQKHDQQREQG